jgi:cytidylate kinase
LIITISRQFRAGGSEVAAEVAEALGWSVVDDSLVDAVAERSGFSPEEVRSLEESVPTFMERFAQYSALASPEGLLSTPSAIESPATTTLAHVTRSVIEEFARRDRIVLVGRAAAAVLEAERDAIHVRLVAPLSLRLRATMDALGCSEEEARVEVQERDENRARYHRDLFGRDWNDPLNYHLVLNAGALGVSGAAELIVARARALGWSAKGPVS